MIYEPYVRVGLFFFLRSRYFVSPSALFLTASDSPLNSSDDPLGFYFSDLNIVNSSASLVK